MNQKEIGSFLKKLRNEKKLTQAELAEIMNVSDKTVSRWERGSNMPDISMIIELADFYDVNIREILEGEKRSENMDKDVKETAIMVADYESNEKKKILILQQIFAWLGLISLIAHTILKYTVTVMSSTVEATSGFLLGLGTGCMVVIIIFGGKYMSKIAAFKKKLDIKNEVKDFVLFCVN